MDAASKAREGVWARERRRAQAHIGKFRKIRQTGIGAWAERCAQTRDYGKRWQRSAQGEKGSVSQLTVCTSHQGFEG